MRDLTKGSVTSHVLHMSAFTGITMLFQTLYFLVDLYFVSGIGKAAIAGVGLSGNLMMLVMALTQSLGVGTTSLIARAAGRRDREDAQTVFNQSFALSAIVGAAVVLLGLVFRDAYCRALSADEATLREGTAYLRWFLPGLGMQFLLVSMSSALRGTGIVKPSTIVGVLSVLTNIILAPVLIAGWATGRPMGVEGAGLATLCAVTCAGVVLAVLFARLETFVSFEWPRMIPRFGDWKRILAIGLPSGGEFALLSLYTAVVYRVIRGFGPEAQAGFGIGVRVVQSMFLPVLAISFSAAPVAGQNFGAKLPDRVRQTFRTAASMGVGLMLLLTALCSIWPEPMIRAFTSEAAVVAHGVEYLQVVCWSFAGSALIFTSSGMFQAMGNTVPPLANSAARLAVFIPAAAWLSARPGFRLPHLWWLAVATGLVQAVSVVWLLHREFARKLSVDK